MFFVAKPLHALSGSILEIHRALMERPIASPKWLAEKTGLTPTTVNTVLDRMVELGIINELTGKRRNRLYGYTQYIAVLNLGTEIRGRY